ncbi:cyclic nucleotide-binding domain-containing protein, partial [Myxococcota bacterium]|nr:cyclic nucleotide-binding domain-containing protein [Myxococcota bacterium]
EAPPSVGAELELDVERSARRPAPAPAPRLEIERTSERRDTRPEPRGAALLAMPLRDVVPGAQPVRGDPSNGIYRIPLDGDVADDDALVLELEETIPPGGPEPHIALDAGGNVTTTPATTLEDLAIASVEEEVRAAERANAALSKVPLFSQLPEKALGELLLHARLVELADQEELFHQGDVGDALYVVAEGTVGVIDEGPPRRGIAKLGEGQFFGEIALVTEEPRTATIAALGPVQLIAIDRAVVERVTSSDPAFLTALLKFLRERLVDKLLRVNPLFTSLSARDRDALLPRFRFLEVEPGATLVAEGRRPDGLVMLLAGDAEVCRAQGSAKVALGALHGGDVCGETALLTGGPAFASVVARTKLFALELPAAAFQTIVSARPEALAFVKRIMEQRIAESHAILSGKASYKEGRVPVL